MRQHLHKYASCFSYMFVNEPDVATVSLLADYFRISCDKSTISSSRSPFLLGFLKCRNSAKTFSPHYLVWCEANERIPARAGKASTRQRESCSMPPEFNGSAGAQLPASLHTLVVSLVQFAKRSVAICDHLAVCLVLLFSQCRISQPALWRPSLFTQLKQNLLRYSSLLCSFSVDANVGFLSDLLLSWEWPSRQTRVDHLALTTHQNKSDYC